jgi:uncharacterized membrane protein
MPRGACMGRRRNSEPQPHGLVELPIRRPEPAVRLDSRQGTSRLPRIASAAQVLTVESGPIPSPEALRRYDRVQPGLAKQLVGWAEQEAQHRRAVERSLIRLSWGGLWCALVVALVTVVGGMMLAWRGRSTAGLIGVIGAVAGLVIVFLAGRRQLPPDTAVPAQAAA